MHKLVPAQLTPVAWFSASKVGLGTYFTPGSQPGAWLLGALRLFSGIELLSHSSCSHICLPTLLLSKFLGKEPWVLRPRTQIPAPVPPSAEAHPQVRAWPGPMPRTPCRVLSSHQDSQHHQGPASPSTGKRHGCCFISLHCLPFLVILDHYWLS